MAQPVLVKAYSGRRNHGPRDGGVTTKALPPISAYAFADILRAADSPELQIAIDGIAEICAKNRMSLADEYASHLPPLGEITTTTPATMKPHLQRPGMRPALTSVPEASSGSSEGSRKSKRRMDIFAFRKQSAAKNGVSGRMRIGSMGRTIPTGCTTSLAPDLSLWPVRTRAVSDSSALQQPALRPVSRSISEARSSLQRLLLPKQAQAPAPG